jgi:hypothetical protein
MNLNQQIMQLYIPYLLQIIKNMLINNIVNYYNYMNIVVVNTKILLNQLHYIIMIIQILSMII